MSVTLFIAVGLAFIGLLAGLMQAVCTCWRDGTCIPLVIYLGIAIPGVYLVWKALRQLKYARDDSEQGGVKE